MTLMTADSTVVDSIRTYPYDGNALFHFSLPAKTQNIILRAEQEGYETGYVSMKVRYYKREKEVYAPWINLKKRNSMLTIPLYPKSRTNPLQKQLISKSAL